MRFGAQVYMDIHLIASILSGIVSIACYVPYIRDILRGKTVPERASWLIWAVLGSIAFFSQYVLGSRLALSFVAVQAIGITVIFFLSLRQGRGVLGKRDLLALYAACQGLIVWHFMDSPLVALLTVILIDAIGLVLTLYKTYQRPETETASAWALAGLSAVFALVALDEWNLLFALYPLYTIGLNVAVLGTIWLGKKRRSYA